MRAVRTVVAAEVQLCSSKHRREVWGRFFTEMQITYRERKRDRDNKEGRVELFGLLVMSAIIHSFIHQAYAIELN